MDQDLVILALNARWGCAIPFGWVPIIGAGQVPDTEIYSAQAFDQLLKDLGPVIQRLYPGELIEVREGGAVGRPDQEAACWGYDGQEYLYTNDTFDFVLYFSHEGTVTVGGRQLLAEIHRRWPAYRQHLWSGKLS
ncbi:hypothetical protein EJV47_17920 [Hymenobacter gummosus]|uniref:Uncharacterized protein n=1 Tax=Hymenobacter gummosus TaxID=1776032 RepID=A0A3S0JCJ1_9BACT|nr:hypothetical protein [Hymenobacter gummosus]RTQ47799.1 hypothetical protein EJV47_17920 [Hymenobacter gummosus]